MIIVVQKEFASSDLLEELCRHYQTRPIMLEDEQLVVTSSSVKELEDRFKPLASRVQVCASDIQLSSKDFKPKRRIEFNDLTIGDGSTLVITGPCSIESQTQIRSVAEFLVRIGVKVMRAGAFKPRTSPYSFQGMGIEGLKLLRSTTDEFGLHLITEVRDATHVADVIEYSDIVQIGAKAMYDHGILHACGDTRKPVLLKRGFGTTLQEFCQAAEFILSRGNPNVVLCERGLRTFETKTRFTLDLCGVAFLKEYTNLPVFVDPTHAMGYAYGVADLARASVAMGIDGLLIETHPNPAVAKSDASQQLNYAQFEELHRTLGPVAAAVGSSIA